MPEHSCLTFPLYCVESLPAQLLEHSPRGQCHGLPLFFRSEKEVVLGVVVLLIFALVYLNMCYVASPLGGNCWTCCS